MIVNKVFGLKNSLKFHFDRKEFAQKGCLKETSVAVALCRVQ